MTSPSRTEETRHPYRLLLFGLIVAAFCLRIAILPTRSFDPDEFQHLHSAHQIYAGELPYRDYFEHHTPFMHVILAALYPLTGESPDVLFVARGVMLVFAAAILGLTFTLTRQLYGTDAALCATLLLSTVVMFVEKSVEVRPDLGAVTFWLGAIVCLVQGRRHATAPWRWYLLSGLAMGTSVMFTQKSLFGVPGLLAASLYPLIDRRAGASWRGQAEAVVALVAGMAAPALVTSGFFLVHGALRQFVFCNLVINARWRAAFSPVPFLKLLISQNSWFMATALAGVLVTVAGLCRRDDVRRGRYIPIACLGSVAAGLFIIPVLYKQYYLLGLPLLAVFAGALVGEALEWNVRRSNGGILPSQRSTRWIVVLIVIGVAFQPLEQMTPSRMAGTVPVERQLRDIRFVMASTTPSDAVFDAWSGYGFLRPHAFYYYFLHWEMRAMLGERELSGPLIESLRMRNPKIVVYDDDIKALPVAVQNYIQSRYVPAGLDDIYIRRD